MKYFVQQNFLKTIHLLFVNLLIFSFVPMLLPAQVVPKLPPEIPDDPYMSPPALRETSAGYRSVTSQYFTTQVNVNADGENIVGDAANEPSIAIDPTNSNRIVIGWRQFDNVNSNFRQAGYAYSSDAGKTWTFPGVIDSGVFRSDPVLDFDAEGNFYYNSLTVDQYNNFSCNVYRTSNGNFSWDYGPYAYGGDKQWMAIDRTNSMGKGNVYAMWSYYYSSCNPGFFTRSIDDGDTYQSCTTVAGSPYWGTMAVGLDGALFAAGVSGDNGEFVVAKSSTAKNPESNVSWDFSTNVDLGGYMQSADGPNPVGLKGQVWIAVDSSNGQGRGNVYILCSVKPNNSFDPCDVMFARSTDGGHTWDTPVRINDDTTDNTWQWFGTMSVAPNGRIDVVWLDTRDNPGTYNSSLYYSYSIDQGETWSQNQRISNAFDPHVGWPQQQKMGDYYNMVSLSNGVHLAWANTLNGEQDVYYTHIYSGFEGVNQHSFSQISLSAYPNPVRSATNIRYSIEHNGKIKIIVSDMLGKQIACLANKEQKAGNYLLRWNASDLPEGVYYCRLDNGKYQKTIKLLVVR